MLYLTHSWIGKPRVLSFDSRATLVRFLDRFGKYGGLREIKKDEALRIVISEGQPADARSDFSSHIHITPTAFEALPDSQDLTST